MHIFQQIVRHIKNNTKLSLISTLSYWDAFPLLPGKKIDRKSVEAAVINGRKSVCNLEKEAEEASWQYCQIL